MYEDLIRNLRICQDGEHCDNCGYYAMKMANGLNACTEELCKQAADAIDGLDTLLDGAKANNDALCETIEMLKKQAFDMSSLIGDYSEKTRWIPVTERLPEDRHDVLVYAGVLFPYITVGYYDGLWKFSFNDEEIAGSADYWMPLPEPPMEET